MIKKYLWILCIFGSACTVIQAQTLVPYLEGEVYGYSDLKGKIQIEPKYNSASLFNESGHAYVSGGHSYYFINRQDEHVVPFDLPVHHDGLFDNIRVDEYTGYFKYTKGHVIGFIDKDLNFVLEHQGTRLRKLYLGDDRFFVVSYSGNPAKIVLDRDGNQLVKAVNGNVKWSYGYLIISERNEDGKTQKYGMADSLGNVIFEPINDHIKIKRSADGLMFQVKNEDEFKFYNESLELLGSTNIGEELMQADMIIGHKPYVGVPITKRSVDYDFGYVLKDSTFIRLYRHEGAYMILDKKGFDLGITDGCEIKDYLNVSIEHGLFIVHNDKGQGLKDHSGDWLLKPQESELSLHLPNWVFSKADGLFKLLKTDDSVLSLENLNQVMPLGEGNMAFELAEEPGYLQIYDRQRTKLKTIEADTMYLLWSPKRTRYLFKKDGLVGLLSDNFEVILEPNYGKIERTGYFSENELYKIQKDTVGQIFSIKENKVVIHDTDKLKFSLYEMFKQLAPARFYACYSDGCFITDENENKLFAVSGFINYPWHQTALDPNLIWVSRASEKFLLNLENGFEYRSN